jgi:CubicO group peptidase (beta-lactamase class C family)
MRLAQAGRIRLDAPLAEAWPTFPNPALAAQVTVSQLLTHTAGLGNHVFFKREPWLTANSAHTDIMKLFQDEPLAGVPGAQVSYSNDGYVLLGALVEQLTGMEFRAHCARTIFAPLGMHSTGYLSYDDITPNIALPYVRDLERQGTWRAAIVQEAMQASAGTAAGGVTTTVDDLALFLRAMASNRLLDREWTSAWTQDRVDFPGRGRYGFGLEIGLLNGHRTTGHAGGHFGLAGEAVWIQPSGCIAVVLSNGEVEPFWSIANFIRVGLEGESPGSRAYDWTSQLIAAIVTLGVDAGLATAATRPDVRPREGMIDVYGFRAWHEGRAAASEALLTFNCRRFPDSLSALWSIAEFYRLAGRRQEAVRAYETYLERQPGDEDAQRVISALRAKPD